MKTLIKNRKKYWRAFFSAGYALLAVYILLNTSFLQLSIYTYIQQQNHLTVVSDKERPAQQVFSLQQLARLRGEKTVSVPAGNAVKIDELFFLSVVTLSNLSVTERAQLADFCAIEQSAFIKAATRNHHFSLYHVPGRRAPPLL